jgi:hypothetical protein
MAMLTFETAAMKRFADIITHINSSLSSSLGSLEATSLVGMGILWYLLLVLDPSYAIGLSE